LSPALRRLQGLSEGVQLSVYEEVEFEAQVLFTPVREDRTLKEAELQNGDIIIFQTLPVPSGGAASPVAATDSMRAMSVEGAAPHPLAPSALDSSALPLAIPNFFSAVKNRVTVNLFKLQHASDGANIRERELPVKVAMDKRMSYDDVVAAVGQAVGCNAGFVRLTMHNCYTEQPKPAPVKFRGVNTLLELLTSFHKTSDTLYYEVLDIPLEELESKKSLRVSWHNLQCDETKVLSLLLAKETTVGTALEMIKQQVTLQLPTTDVHTGEALPAARCMRMLELFNHRIFKVFDNDEQIDNINDQYWTIRAEEIPVEERHMGADDRLVQVRHFYQEVKISMIHNFGEPFLMLIACDDTLAIVRQRINERLKLSPEEFAELKLGVINFGRIEYINETESVRARFRVEQGSMDDYLGIEHPGAPSGPAARKRFGARTTDKPIKIHA